MQNIKDALEGLKKVVELAVTKEDGTQYAYLETRHGSFVHVADALKQAELALSALSAEQYPIRLPDGVIYWDPGCITYPKDHSYSLMCNRVSGLQMALHKLGKHLHAGQCVVDGEISAKCAAALDVIAHDTKTQESGE